MDVNLHAAFLCHQGFNLIRLIFDHQAFLNAFLNALGRNAVDPVVLQLFCPPSLCHLNHTAHRIRHGIGVEDDFSVHMSGRPARCLNQGGL